MKKDRSLLTLILAVMISIVHWLYIYLIRSTYLNIRYINPLAMLHSLFPIYYVTIFCFALICLFYVFHNTGNKYFHILLLFQFALMLYFTPYSLSDFVRTPDGIWHSSVSLYIPEIMKGDPILFSKYALSYPSFFIQNYVMLKITGINHKAYVGIIYPLIYTFIIIFLWYIFISRLFSQRISFLGTLIALPGLHYINIIPSPRIAGFILLLSSLIFLLTCKNLEGKASGLICLLILIITHPIHPLTLIIFLISVYIVRYIFRDTKVQVALNTLIISYVSWIYWQLFHAVGIADSIITRIYRIVTLQFLKGFQLAQEYISGTPFIYPEIYSLNRIVYLSYLTIMASLFCYTFISALKSKRNIRSALKSLVQTLRFNGMIMILSSLFLLIFSVLFMIWGVQVLIERGLTLFILSISSVIASQLLHILMLSQINKVKIVNIKKRLNIAIIAPVLLGIWFLVVVLTYPVISYSLDAYVGFSSSEDVGLAYLTSNVPLDGQKIAMTFERQLVLYTPYLNQTKFIRLLSMSPPNLNELKPTLIVFRKTGYYYAAMRLDLSFEDNRFKAYLDIANRYYNKIYSNPAFEIFKKV